MLVGIPPFNDDSIEKIFSNIKSRKIPWDLVSIGYEEDMISPDAFDIINRLLDPVQRTRLGYNGVGDIKIHSFFKNTKWESHVRSPGPIIPQPEESNQ